MLTIVGLPKAFTGQFKVIQENAIRSWARLEPKPEIILFGDDEGTAAMAQEVGAKHEPQMNRNEFGTPLLNGVLERAQELSSNDLIVYVNSDIILPSSFMRAVHALSGRYGDSQFLGVGRKCNVPLTEPLPFDGDWESMLADAAQSSGVYVTYDSDYFVFRRGLWRGMPSFAVGRCYWTQWMMYTARRQGVDMIDMTPMVLAVESKHDYSHAKSTGFNARLSGVEYEANRRLFRGCRYYTTVNATHVLHGDKIDPAPFKNHLLSAVVRSQYFVYFLLKGTWYPYSLPLILVARSALTCLRVLRSVPRRLRAGAA